LFANFFLLAVSFEPISLARLVLPNAWWPVLLPSCGSGIGDLVI